LLLLLLLGYQASIVLSLTVRNTVTILMKYLFSPERLAERTFFFILRVMIATFDKKYICEIMS